MQGRRVLVTGGTGFVGSHLIRALVRAGAEVFTLRRKESSPIRLELLGVVDAVRFLEGDLTSPGTALAALEASEAEVVYHLAAYGVRGKDRDFATNLAVNVLGSAYLVEACTRRPIRRFVWMGSGFEYGRPKTAPTDESAPLEPILWYGATKVAAWELARFFQRTEGLDFVTARLFSTFGPAEHPSRFVPHVITHGLEGTPVELTSGEQQRDYLYVEDVADALVRLAETPGISGEVYNLGSGEGCSIRDIAELILDLMGHPVELRVGARAREREEPDKLVADSAKLRLMGWMPRASLKDGLQQTIDWYAEHRHLWKMLP